MTTTSVRSRVCGPPPRSSDSLEQPKLRTRDAFGIPAPHYSQEAVRTTPARRDRKRDRSDLATDSFLSAAATEGRPVADRRCWAASFHVPKTFQRVEKGSG